ncbi:hypothetical protein OG909_32415 [Streptomyces sp. NBC_01754]|uniref:hypothetical protein n=1 Tax=Streptomyces sp. NBC_01754 TaxID=2975930 RepID=UPI002DDB9A45|nr:hypothetical protein [Streptomyces sp. NBC_01754]WSC90866.1 hypothetical protein OG909_00290 [Streptomyces sp. NBC_01754]WSC96639.1 hypothetical protein OG909_32415 [Streptomyces sp. NBC_01754]
MREPPDRIYVAEGLRHILQELSAIERSVEHDLPGRPAPYTDVDEPWDGPEFRVETVSDNSMHTVVGISARRGPGPVPTDPGAPDEDEAAILRATVRAFLDLADIGSERASTTVVLTERGPRVVSCRLGSGATVFARERRPATG